MEGGRLMVDDGRGMMDDGRGICFVLPSRQSVGVVAPIPRDFVPGYCRFALWRLPDAIRP